VPEATIVSAVRTAVGTAKKGTLAETPAEDLAGVVLLSAIERAGVDPAVIGDVVFAESLYGGGVIGRYALAANGLSHVPAQAVNRHCAGSLAALSNAAASVRSGMERVVLAGGVQSASLSPRSRRRVPGSDDEVAWISPTHPDRPDAPNLDMSITVGWNTAVAAQLSREDQDAWALRSHERAVAAIDAGLFADEIVPVKALRRDGSYTDFAVDEHPRRDTSMDRLASLKPLHPEIDGFSVTAGNSSGVNDAAAAIVLTSDEFAAAEGLETLGRVRAWGATAIDPSRTGLAPLDAIPLVLSRAGVSLPDVALWEINEAFASVPLAACRLLGIDDERVNIHGSGCSLGHPVAATGARMVTTLLNDLRRQGGGIGVAAMCAGGGMAGAVVLEV
jgi:acetyl-CoA C-acetyltransferase